MLQKGFIEDVVKQKPKLSRKKKKTFSCEDCELTGRRIISGQGNVEQAQVVVITDVPTKTDEDEGKIFMSRSGQLFQTLLFEKGASFKDVYFTSVVKCRTDRSVAPSKQTMKCCASKLDLELSQAKNRKLIIACGVDVAVRLGVDCGSSDRGKFYDTQYGKVMLTYHPVDALKNIDTEYYFKSGLELLVNDIQRAKEFVDVGRWYKDIASKVRIVLSAYDIKRMCNSFESFDGDVGLDFETNMLDVYHSDFKVISCAISKGTDEVWYVGARVLVLDELYTQALDCVRDIYYKSKVVMHGSSFDLQVASKLGWKLKEVDDNLLLLYLLDGGKRIGGKGLKRLALDYTDYGDYGVDVKNIDSLLDDELVRYNCTDVLATVELFQLIRSKMTDNLMYCYEKVMKPAQVLLTTATINGMKIDVKYAIKLSKELQSRVEVYEARANFIVGHTISLSSPKQVLNYLNSIGCNVISTGEEILRPLEKNYEFIKLLLEYRSAVKLLSTYVLPYIKEHAREDNMIHGRFSLTVAATGRASSSDPNLQNIPHKDGPLIEKMFISRFEDGFVLKADYSQQELRIAAVYGQDEKMSEFFKSGKDIHRMTAVEIYKTPESWFESSDSVELKKAKEARQVAKGFNFGVIYGRGAYSISKELGIPLMQAEEFRANYLALFTGLGKWLVDTRKFALQNGYVQSMFGRIRYLDSQSSEQYIREEALRQAVNTPVQGAASDVALLGGKAVKDEIDRLGLKTKFINFVHDALFFDVPADELQQVICIIKEKAVKIELPIKTDVPLGIEIEYGKSWGDCK